MLWLWELPGAVGLQRRSVAIDSSLLLHPSLLRVSLGAMFTCPSLAEFLPPQEAPTCIFHQFPCKAASPGES